MPIISILRFKPISTVVALLSLYPDEAAPLALRRTLDCLFPPPQHAASQNLWTSAVDELPAELRPQLIDDPSSSSGSDSSDVGLFTSDDERC